MLHLDQESNRLIVKLIGFGESTLLQDDRSNMTSLRGTLPYIAPEVLNQNYDKKGDIW